MKVHICTPNINFPDEPHQLIFQPQSDDDRKKLEHLLSRYKTIGFGRDPVTWKLLHVSVTIVPN